MTTEVTRRAVFPAGLINLAETVDRFLAGVASGWRAAADWERLNRMTDSQLAETGLTRETLGRAVFERNFG